MPAYIIFNNWFLAVGVAGWIAAGIFNFLDTSQWRVSALGTNWRVSVLLEAFFLTWVIIAVAMFLVLLPVTLHQHPHHHSL